MAKRNFTYAERYAVYTVHGEKCWICDEAVDLSTMEVDHVLPESLEGRPELPDICKGFGLPADFDLNSWPNLRPAHSRCNNRKGHHVFKPTPMIQLVLEDGQEKMTRLQETRDGFLSDRALSIAVTRILAAAEAGALDEKHYRRLGRIAAAKHEIYREPELKGKPFALAPGLTIVGEDHSFLYLRGRGGLTGYRPKAEKIDISFDCPNCGPTGWNGTRCIQCGMLIDPD